MRCNDKLILLIEISIGQQREQHPDLRVRKKILLRLLHDINEIRRDP
jgi:hypothetical protein